MSENTKIEWADHTFNPWTGCRRVSPGCLHCYMFAFLKRFGRDATERLRTSAATWRNPVKWNQQAREPLIVNYGQTDDLGEPAKLFPPRPRVFPSFCDWLDDEVPIEWLADFLKLIHDTPNLDWLLLTKRPRLFLPRLVAVMRHLENNGEGSLYDSLHPWVLDWADGTNPPECVWVGTSVEDQQRADERIPQLLKIPAKVRFLSVEPLLGPVDLQYPAFNGVDSIQSLEGLHWIIVGGESGPGARACNVEWIRSIMQQCKVAGVPCFVKQLGSHPIHKMSAIDLMHKKGGDPSEWPEDLRVREFPKV